VGHLRVDPAAATFNVLEVDPISSISLEHARHRLSLGSLWEATPSSLVAAILPAARTSSGWVRQALRRLKFALGAVRLVDVYPLAVAARVVGILAPIRARQLVTPVREKDAPVDRAKPDAIRIEAVERLEESVVQRVQPAAFSVSSATSCSHA